MLKPTLFAAVPRILTRVYAKIYEGVRAKGGVSEWLFNKAVETKLHNYENYGILTHNFYDKVVFKKIRDIFGGNLTKMVCGSAALDGKTLKFFRIALGIYVYEGYGQTENNVVATATHPSDTTTGHVGCHSDAAKLRLKDVPEMNYYHTDNPPRGEL